MRALSSIILFWCVVSAVLFGSFTFLSPPALSQAHDPFRGHTPFPFVEGMETGVLITTDLTFDRLSDVEGLSQNNVLAIVQDRQGFMWFGTQDGLNRYDGYNFKIFRHDPRNVQSLSDNSVTVLFQDLERANVMWVGTGSGDLNEFDLHTETFRAFRPDSSASPASDMINAVTAFPNSPSILWVGGTNGLFCLDRLTGSFTRYTIAPDGGKDRIASLYAEGDSILWIGGLEGKLIRFNVSIRKVTQTIALPDLFPPAIPYYASSFQRDRSGEMWIGTTGKLMKMSFQNERRGHGAKAEFTVLDIPASNIAIDSLLPNTLWLGSTFFGMRRFNYVTGEQEMLKFVPGLSFSLSSDNVVQTYVSHSGDLWVGTRGGGISKYSPWKKRFRNYGRNSAYPNSLLNTSMRGIVEDASGVLWIAGYQGLDALESTTGRVVHYHLFSGGQLATFPIFSLLSYGNNLLLGFEGKRGVMKLNTRTGRVAPFPRYSGKSPPIDVPVFTMLRDRGGGIWVGERTSVCRIINGMMRRYEVPALPMAMAEDPDGSLWVGTDGAGVIRLNPASGETRHHRRRVNDTGTLSHDAIRSLHIARDSTVWVGTAGGGLNRYLRHSDTFRHYTSSDGLPNEFIYGILEDDHGNLWFSTNKGIAKFHPEKGMLKTYDASDGLQGNEFNTGSSMKTSNGMMYFGGLNGVTAFHPDRLRDNPFIPPIVLISVHGANGTLATDTAFAMKRSFVFSSDENIVTFEFAGLDFTTPKKNRYAYRLAGFQKEWVDLGTKREVTFTNLDPGTYELQVRAANNDGKWNTAGLSLHLIVEPKYYQTALFKILAGAAVLMFLSVGVWLRLQGVRKRNRALQDEVLQRKQAEDQFRMLWESSPDALVSIDVTGTIVTVNAGVERIFGYKREELLYQSIDVLLPEFLPYSKAQAESLLPQLGARDLQGLRKDGSMFPAAVTISTVHSQKGAKRTIAIRDISERMALLREVQIAHDRSRALSAHLQEVTEHERQTVARDVHDEFGAALTSLKIGMTVLERTVRDGDQNGTDHNALLPEVRAMKDIVDAMSLSTRKLIRRLRPEVLDALGIHAGLQWLVNDWQQRTGIPCIFHSNVLELTLDERISTVIFRTVQEALTNVARHAKAKSVTINLTSSDSGISVDVLDDGIGISQERLENVHTFGILGMRERLRQVQGALEIHRGSHGGTVVQLRIPKSLSLP